MTITAKDLVHREVLVCVSSIVHTLAKGAGMATGPGAGLDLESLTEQALELAAPMPDYEEAARDAGWRLEEATREGSACWYAYKMIDGVKQIGSDQFKTQRAAWADVCDAQEIEPYEYEVFEHWAITKWLADELEARGEKVDRDFAGLVVWARTTTGQAIAIDSVILEIAEKLNQT